MKSRSGRGQPKRNFQRVRLWTTAYSALGPSGTGCPQLPTYPLVPLAPRSLAAVRTHSTNPGAIWSLCGAKQSARFWRRNFGHPLPDSVAFVDERAARFVCRWLEIVGVLRANACLPLRKGGKGYHSRKLKASSRDGGIRRKPRNETTPAMAIAPKCKCQRNIVLLHEVRHPHQCPKG